MTRRAPLPRWETPDPRNVAGSYGPAVRAWNLRHLGRRFGSWQTHAVDKALRHDRHGDLIARIVLLSTGRQNGKTVIVEGILDWMMDEGRHLPPFRGWTEMLAAAHDAKQARKMYDRSRASLEGLPKDWRAEREIHTTQWTGITAGPLVFDTVTGQPGSVRGSTAGLIAWDEMLTQKDWDMWEALSPTQSAQRSPLMLLTSTTGKDESVVLRAFYDTMHRQALGLEKPDRAFYAAWWQSTDPNAGIGSDEHKRPLTAADWEQIRQANPGLGDGRLSRASILQDHRTLPPNSWRRERLNHWVADQKVEPAVDPELWVACRASGPLADADGPFTLGVDIHPGWGRASILVAGVRPDGRVGVEVFADLRAEPGSPITADRIITRAREFPKPVSVVVYDGVSAGAPAFGREAADSYWDWRALKPNEMVAASMDMAELVQSGGIAHDDPLLDAQVGLAARRDVGSEGGFRYTREGSTGPIDAFLAATMAAHVVGLFAGYPSIT